MDKIIIEDLEVFAHHGVMAEENVLGQKFLLSATLHLDLHHAGIWDDLSATINYAVVCREITDLMKEQQYQLIETVGESIAEFLLEKYHQLKSIKLCIKKPWAPIGLPLSFVAVEITRAWHTVYIAFGSNLGDRLAYIQGGIDALGKEPGCYVDKVSEVVNTKPYGGVAQDDFLNGVLRLRTLLTPKELLEKLQEIENRYGRKREEAVRWGPRTLDLDIILYDDIMVNENQLIIPHIDFENRPFVLEPLLEIAPGLRHPATGILLRDILGRRDSNPIGFKSC